MKKPKTFLIESENTHLLQAMWYDLKELGYELLGDISDIKQYKGIETNPAVITTKEKFIRICPFRSSKSVHFTLPAQYEEALQFAKEQINSKYWDKEEELELNRWYKLKGSPAFVFFNENVGSYDTTGYGLGGDGTWIDGIHSDGPSSWELATDKEVEAMLIKEAKKRGFKKGVRTINVHPSGKSYGHDDPYVCDGKLSYDKDEDSLTDNDGNRLFASGKWAEIIEEAETLMFGDVEVEIRNYYAHTKHGNIYPEAISCILNLKISSDRASWDVDFSDDTEIEIGCESGTIGELRKIYEALTR